MNRRSVPYLRCEECGKKGVYPHSDLRYCRYCGARPTLPLSEHPGANATGDSPARATPKEGNA